MNIRYVLFSVPKFAEQFFTGVKNLFHTVGSAFASVGEAFQKVVQSASHPFGGRKVSVVQKQPSSEEIERAAAEALKKENEKVRESVDKIISPIVEQKKSETNTEIERLKVEQWKYKGYAGNSYRQIRNRLGEELAQAELKNEQLKALSSKLPEIQTKEDLQKMASILKYFALPTNI